MKRFAEPILVTRPYLPPLEEFKAGCAEIWQNRWLTNNGPLLQRFHAALADYLGGASANHAYCPVLFRDEATREKVYAGLKERCNVYSRRYFYPLLTDFAPYIYGKGSCPVAEDASRRVLTLPTYYGLEPSAAAEIAKCVLEIAET